MLSISASPVISVLYRWLLGYLVHWYSSHILHHYGELWVFYLKVFLCNVLVIWILLSLIEDHSPSFSLYPFFLVNLPLSLHFSLSESTCFKCIFYDQHRVEFLLYAPMWICFLWTGNLISSMFIDNVMLELNSVILVYNYCVI